MRRKQINDKWYRWRRGRWVRIPDKWVNVVTHSQTIRKRQSKYTKKIKRWMQAVNKGKDPKFKDKKYGMLDDER